MSAVTVRAHANAQPPGSTSTWTISFPGTPQVGDPIGIWITTDGSTNTITAPTGWTLEYNTTVGSGSRHFIHKLYASADGASVAVPLNTSWGAGHGKAAILVMDGSVHSGFGTVGTITTRSSASTSATALATGSAGTPNLIVFHEKTTSQTSCVVSGATDIENVLPNTGIAGSVYVGSYDDAAATATYTAAYGGTANSNACGYQVPLNLSAPTAPAALSGSGTLTAGGTLAETAAAALTGSGVLSAVAGNAAAAALTGTGTLSATSTMAEAAPAALTGSGSLTAAATPGPAAFAAFSGSGSLGPRTAVEVWESQVELDVAHFGGDISPAPPGLVLNSYQWSDKWNSWMAFEAPCWMSSDGVWVVCHDQTTGSVFNANYDITVTPWSTLATLTSTVGGYPIQRLQDLLDAFPNRAFFVEDKGSQNISGFLNLLDAHGGYQRIIVKQYFNNTAVPPAAHARGYRTWGYYYDADVASAPTTQQNWDYLGLEVNATSAHWTQMLSYGKPVLAHVAQTAANRATAAAQGANGYMASGVEQVIPQSPVMAGLTGSGSLSGTGTVQTGTAAALTGTGSLSAGTLTPAVGTGAALAGAGSLTAAAAPAESAAGALNGSGVLSGTGTPQTAASAALSGGGELTAGTGPTAAALLSGSGALTITVGSGLSGGAALSGAGTLTATLSGAVSGAASLNGGGQLTAATTLAVAAGPVFTGTGVLAATALYVPPRVVQLRLDQAGTRWGITAAALRWRADQRPPRWGLQMEA